MMVQTTQDTNAHTHTVRVAVAHNTTSCCVDSFHISSFCQQDQISHNQTMYEVINTFFIFVCLQLILAHRNYNRCVSRVGHQVQHCLLLIILLLYQQQCATQQDTRNESNKQGHQTYQTSSSSSSTTATATTTPTPTPYVRRYMVLVLVNVIQKKTSKLHGQKCVCTETVEAEEVTDETNRSTEKPNRHN